MRSSDKALTSISALEMREGLLSSRFSAQELTEAHLARIESTADLNSFISVCREQACKQAAAADEVLAKDAENSPLFTGIPIALKDMLVTEGIETTCASKILKGFIPPYSGTAVLKLKQEGAVILGKTNLDEFAMGSSNENSAYGAVKNPWDKSRVAGGSSGGSAVAVSSGQSPLSLGTDTGGSVRQPAAFNGIYGLKPTYGRVSRYGVVAFASSFDQIGPFARTVSDLGFLLGVIAGPDRKDSTSVDVEVPNYLDVLREKEGQDLSGLRIGVPSQYLVEGVTDEVRQSIETALQSFEKLGAVVKNISLPHTEYAIATYYILASAEASSNLSRYDGIRYGKRAEACKSLTELYRKTRALGFGSEVKRRILIGTYVLSAGYYEAYYLKAQQVRTLVINDFREAFAEECDLIVSPTAPTTAFPLGEKLDSPLEMYLADLFTIPASLAGLPAISLPCGFDRQKLPIGMQLIAPAFCEDRLLLAARAYERENPFPTAEMTES